MLILNYLENKLVQHTKEILNMKDEELKEDLIDKLGIAVRMVRRAVA
ncbi:hypothetical protein EfmE980_1415 [Enterococcus faecium E980]|nr:hypothetical protein [Enterococcus faecium]EFF37617.1 hypothetical protein EfmE980_1415 [Enterococcus faecium E980]MDB7508360.1 hypothetical protein [Enterococcus faecium]MDB7516140.1 hypothetical protein [Enterococcus faecium]